jgi:mono/diheme cytochrome c family protein
VGTRLCGFATVGAVIVAVVVVVVPLRGAIQNAPNNPGKTAFERICAGCHGNEGAGDIGPRLVPFSRSNRELLAIVREGVGMMPAVSARDIGDAEVAAVAEYLRSLTEKSSAR